MRLIDTDEMNEKLFYRELGGKDVLITAKSVFDMIKALPTAYDVEKVVAELEEKKNESLQLWKQYQLKDDFGKMFAFDEAIKIVNGGRNR